MSHQSALSAAFIKVGEKFFAANSQVEHKWSIDCEGEYCVLEIPMAHENGFDIHVEVGAEVITIHCGDYHDHHELEGNVQDYANHFFGYLNDLLTPMMRLREYTSNGRGYKWAIECREGERWIVESTTGSLFYNYFGAKKECVLQNQTLPERPNALSN